MRSLLTTRAPHQPGFCSSPGMDKFGVTSLTSVELFQNCTRVKEGSICFLKMDAIKLIENNRCIKEQQEERGSLLAEREGRGENTQSSHLHPHGCWSREFLSMKRAKQKIAQKSRIPMFSRQEQNRNVILEGSARIHRCSQQNGGLLGHNQIAESVGAKQYPQQRSIKLGNLELSWSHTRLWNQLFMVLVERAMPSKGQFPSSLQVMVSQERFLWSERQIQSPFSRLEIDKATEPILLKAISSHRRDEKVAGRSQHGFIKGKSRLTNFIPFYDEKAGSLEGERAGNVAHLVLSALQCHLVLKMYIL
ncbi:hypothetical protein BTVI_20216 [Pitangus sulphuratus]|nr:hypothetical protein BTVI_20216 [Pitangus sulphuratus]